MRCNRCGNVNGTHYAICSWSQPFNMLSAVKDASIYLLKKDSWRIIKGKHVFCGECCNHLVSDLSPNVIQALKGIIKLNSTNHLLKKTVTGSNKDDNIKNMWSNFATQIKTDLELDTTPHPDKLYYWHHEISMLGVVSKDTGEKYFRYVEKARQLSKHGYVIISNWQSDKLFNSLPSTIEWGKHLLKMPNLTFETLYSLRDTHGTPQPKQRSWKKLLTSSVIESSYKGTKKNDKLPNYLASKDSGKRLATPSPIGKIQKWLATHLPWIAHIDIYICLTAKINLLEKKKDDVTKKAKVDDLDGDTKAKVDELKKRRDELCIPESINALSRAEGLKISQDFHVDSTSEGNLFVLHPLSKHYDFNLFPRSHHLIRDNKYEEIKDRGIPQDMLETLTLEPNQLLICMSSCIHGGGVSSENVTSLTDLLSLPINNNIKVCRGGSLTDFSLQFSVYQGEGLTAASAYKVGRPSTLGKIKLLCTNEIKKEKFRYSNKDIDDADYEQAKLHFSKSLDDAETKHTKLINQTIDQFKGDVSVKKRKLRN